MASINNVIRVRLASDAGGGVPGALVFPAKGLFSRFGAINCQGRIYCGGMIPC